MNTEVLKLGKLLVKELGLESSVDTLSRWMAHYIAQQMTEIESSSGTDKQAAEEKCFVTILKLWKHRAYYETGDKPFENFEPIFQTLDTLNPDNEEPFYFQSEYAARDKSDNADDAVKQYLLMATKIDETVRVWLKFIFQHAAEQAVDEKTKEWIKAAAPLTDNDEASLIVRILSEHDIDEKDREEKTKLLKHRIEQLKSFREFNEELIAMYEEELNALR
jgi:hypothetical protein